jgi:hypothetical protein
MSRQCPYDADFAKLEADGSATATTTKLTLTFDQAFPAPPEGWIDNDRHVIFVRRNTQDGLEESPCVRNVLPEEPN